MSTPQKPVTRNGKFRPGCSVSFAEAAATSVVAPDTGPPAGAVVRLAGREWWGEFTVTNNVGCAGGDGRHWVQVQGRGVTFHVQAHECVRVWS